MPAIASLIRYDNVDISLPPEFDPDLPEPDPSIKQVVEADLHANTLRLLWVCLFHGIITMQSGDHLRLIGYYFNQDAGLEDFKKIRSLIKKIKILNTELFMHLIGDETGDRGYRESFNILVFTKLHQEHVLFSILLSNHGFELIRALEQVLNTPGMTNIDLSDVSIGKKLDDKQMMCASLYRLQWEISQGYMSLEEVLIFFTQVYQPRLKLIDYIVDPQEKKIVILCHAPIGINNIQDAVKAVGVNYQDDTAEELIASIDEMNRVFQEHYVRQNKVTELMKLAAIFFLAWNREYEGLGRPTSYKGYSLGWGHGHDAKDPRASEEGIYSLETNLGKGLAEIGMGGVGYAADTYICLNSEVPSQKGAFVFGAAALELPKEQQEFTCENI
jgi:hypothetical protein